jgi:hypothetical protein
MVEKARQIFPVMTLIMNKCNHTEEVRNPNLDHTTKRVKGGYLRTANFASDQYEASSNVLLLRISVI